MESSHKDILNPNGVSFDLNTSWRVCSVIEREKKGSSMLTGLLSGLKWINWLNTHGGWSETTPLTPIQLLVIFAANPSVLRDLRIYLAAVKIGPPASATLCAKGNCAIAGIPSNKKTSLGNLSTHSPRDCHIDCTLQYQDSRQNL